MLTPDLTPRWRRGLVALWSAALAALLLGPALAPGYVLSYDMVWVPDLVLRADVLGVGSGLPRAVPSDAVVAVLDEVVPGALLQKVVLLLALVAGGLGLDRLLGESSLPARLAAVTFWQWNPLVVERLVLGHWPVLVGYAALPWVVHGALRWRGESRYPWWLLVVVPLGSLSVSAGLATSLVLLVVLRRHWLPALGLVLAAQAPWLVSGLLHAGDAVTDRSGAALFALSDEGPLPGPLAALTLGGIWNAEVVPASREGALALVALLVLLGLGLLGWLTRERSPVPLGPLVVLWGVGWGLATVSWLAPDALGAVAAVVPGAGVLRDGSRLLVLCAPLLAVLLALGVDAATRWARDRLGPVAAGAAAVVLVLWPVTVLPDAAWGVSGRLGAVDYPAEYAQARSALRDAPGDVLVLPLTSYRQPDWNEGVKVLDPFGRFVTPVPVASDELVVDDEVVAGEDPRVRAAQEALAEPDPGTRAAALGRLGIGAVATTDLGSSGVPPDVSGSTVVESADLRVVVLDEVVERDVPTAWILAMVVAWTAYAGCLLVGVVAGLRGVLVAKRRNLSG